MSLILIFLSKKGDASKGFARQALPLSHDGSSERSTEDPWRTLSTKTRPSPSPILRFPCFPKSSKTLPQHITFLFSTLLPRHSRSARSIYSPSFGTQSETFSPHSLLLACLAFSYGPLEPTNHQPFSTSLKRHFTSKSVIMQIKTITALALASLVSAQTYTDCNPTKKSMFHQILNTQNNG